MADQLGGQGEGGLAVGARIGAYQITRLLGRGGMGEVHEAVHLGLGKKVAIKTLGPACAAVPGASERFLREAQITSRLRHPHIVDVTDVGVDAGRSFLVMEYLEGEDLASRIARGPLSIDEAIDVALPVVAAVAAAHAQGIIHRDLKPQNIFLARAQDGSVHPKVLDFGISKQTGRGSRGAGPLTNPGELCGSPSYIAPEQLDEQQIPSEAIDQYTLGLILYEGLTGHSAFPGPALRTIIETVIVGDYLPPKRHRPELPGGLQQIIARAMSVRPADRYASVRELGQMLLVFASPTTRLRWKDTFRDQAPAAPARAGKPSPVPVTEQTPSATEAPLQPTRILTSR